MLCLYSSYWLIFLCVCLLIKYQINFTKVHAKLELTLITLSIHDTKKRKYVTFWHIICFNIHILTIIITFLQSNFIEITLWHERFPVNLLHLFRAPFLKNTSGGAFSHLFRMFWTFFLAVFPPILDRKATWNAKNNKPALYNYIFTK